jgi:hypothetical protein
MQAAFQARSVPFFVRDAPELRALYERDLLLLRPDMHVAWRDNRLPDNPNELAALATGHGRGG